MPCCASLADSSLHVVTVSCAISVALWLRGELTWPPGSTPPKRSVLLQGERITQGVSYADVSDICLRALHDKAARNRTFEVR